MRGFKSWGVVAAMAAASICGAAEIAVDGLVDGRIAAFQPIVCRFDSGAQSFQWRVFSQQMDVVRAFPIDGHGGAEVVWFGPPGKYLVFCDTASIDAEGKLVRDGAAVNVVIGSAPPVPPGPDPPGPDPPGPDPPGPQPPVIPDGRFKLGRLAYDAAMAIPVEHRAVAGRLADNYELVARGIHGDGVNSRPIPDIPSAQAEIRESNGAVLGGPDSALAKAWFPFLGAWAARVREINPGYPDDLEAVFAETAAGLRAVR